MNQILYDPNGETNSVFRKPQSLPTNLWDKKVMLFDIGKPRSKEFLDYFEEDLKQKRDWFQNVPQNLPTQKPLLRKSSTSW